MSKVTSALLIALTINMFLFFGNEAINDINPGQQLINVNGTMIGERLEYTGGSYQFNGTDTGINDFPAPSSSITEAGLSLIDLPLSFLGWLSGAGHFLVDMMTAVPDFLSAVFPSTKMESIVAGLSVLWYTYILGLLVFFFLGDRG